MAHLVLLSGVEIARQNLAQLEDWVPPDDWSRRRRAENIAQVRAWLAEHDPRMAS